MLDPAMQYSCAYFRGTAGRAACGRMRIFDLCRIRSAPRIRRSRFSLPLGSMNTTVSRIDQTKLDQALADITEHITTPQNWQFALKQLSSIRDYSLGDLRSCTAQAALENCEQIKDYFPPSAPESAIRTMDAIADEIQQIEKAEVPILFQLLANPLVIITIGLAIAVYWFYFR
jgi:hypothetical protein